MGTWKTRAVRRALPGAVCLAALAAAAAVAALPAPQASPQPPPKVLPVQAPATFTCGARTVTFGPTVPGDGIFPGQADADCFAWAEFIALNWPTKPGAGFGDLGDLDPVQWETYMSSDLLFQPGAPSPPPWGAQPAVPAAFRGDATGGPSQVKWLTARSKFTVPPLGPAFQPGQAAPIGLPNWLGAQNGTNVWYEIRVNKDEYDFIVANKFYDSEQQAAWVASGKPILLPAGAVQGTVGAIELKASWMEVPDPSDPKWNSYKLARAVVLDPNTGQPRSATIALVGLHIIHKTQNQPTWIWATFEHVANLPPAPGASGSFNFYSANCASKTFEVPAIALPPGGASPVTVGCVPNQPPPYYLKPGGPGPVPIQVSRLNPIDSDAKAANVAAWAAFAKAYPNSVWKNYQLINVIWSTSPVPDPTKPTPPPRNLGPSMLPPTKVANIVTETYVQNFTCTDCHRSATIAPTPSQPQPNIQSDFSFLLGKASHPPSSPAQ